MPSPLEDGELEDGEVHDDKPPEMEESGEASGCEGVTSEGEHEAVVAGKQQAQQQPLPPRTSSAQLPVPPSPLPPPPAPQQSSLTLAPSRSGRLSDTALPAGGAAGTTGSVQGFAKVRPRSSAHELSGAAVRSRSKTMEGQPLPQASQTLTQPLSPTAQHAAPGSAGPASREHKDKDDREVEELMALLRDLTRSSSFQDVMRSLETVSRDLKQAIKKLDKLFRRVKKRKGDSIEDYPDCFQFSRRILEGLHTVNKFSQTSAFQAAAPEATDAARALFKAAMNYRHDIFNAPLKAELESLVRNSKAFKVVLENRRPNGSGLPSQPSPTQPQPPQPSQREGQQLEQQEQQEDGAAARGGGGAGMARANPDADMRPLAEGEAGRQGPGEATATPAAAELDVGGADMVPEAARSHGEGGAAAGGRAQWPSGSGMDPGAGAVEPEQRPPVPPLPTGEEPGSGPVPMDTDEGTSTAPPPPHGSPGAGHEEPCAVPAPPPADGWAPPGPTAGPGPGSAAAGGSGSGRSVGRSTAPAATNGGGAAGSGFKLKIVVASTEGDLRAAAAAGPPASAPPSAGPTPICLTPVAPPPPVSPVPLPGLPPVGLPAMGLAPSGLPVGLADIPRRPSRFHSPPREQPADEPAAKRSRTDSKPEVPPPASSSRWDRVRTPAAAAAPAPAPAPDAAQQQQQPAVKAEAQGAPAPLQLPANVLRWSSEHSHTAVGALAPPPESPVSDAGGDGPEWERGCGTELQVKQEAADGAPAGAAAAGTTATTSAAHTSSAAEAAHATGGQEAGSAVAASQGHAAGSSHADRERDRDRDRERERERSSRDKDGKEKEREKEREKDKERGRDKDRDRDRSRDKDKDKDKEREKDRERDRSHEKDREKDKERDRDRHRSSKDKDKDREKDKDKEREKERDKDRDKDKDREHSHRSSRHRDRDRDADSAHVKAEAADGPAPGAAAAAAAGRLSDEVASCLGRGRLVLVVDLDGVLADSCWDAQLDGPTAATLARRGAVEAAALPEERRELFRIMLDGAPLWLKLRPGARAFLARAAERFELWARTRQGRPYADAVVELLDPHQSLFGSRVVAQGVLAKRLLAALDARAPVAAVLDTPDAGWMGEALAGCLLAVPPYSYFACRPCAGGGAALAASGMAGRSLLEVDRDECPERGVLAAALPLLESLHSRVLHTYSSPPAGSGSTPTPAPTPASSGAGAAAGSGGAGGAALESWDVRRMLRDLREKVLSGAHITFSRVFAGGAAAGPRHPLWRLAEACGAVCSVGVNDSTTHVVSTSGATEKALWAQQNGRFVVYPSWLECSCYMWRKADEALFLV